MFCLHIIMIWKREKMTACYLSWPDCLGVSVLPFLWTFAFVFWGGGNVKCVVLFDCIFSRHIAYQGTIKILLKVPHVFMISFMMLNRIKSGGVFSKLIRKAWSLWEFKFILILPRCEDCWQKYLVIKASISFKHYDYHGDYGVTPSGTLFHVVMQHLGCHYRFNGDLDEGGGEGLLMSKKSELEEWWLHGADAKT